MHNKLTGAEFYRVKNLQDEDMTSEEIEKEIKADHEAITYVFSSQNYLEYTRQYERTIIDDAAEQRLDKRIENNKELVITNRRLQDFISNLWAMIGLLERRRGKLEREIDENQKYLTTLLELNDCIHDQKQD